MAIPAVAGSAMLHRQQADRQTAQDSNGPALPAETRLVRTDLTALPPPDPPSGTADPALSALRSYGLAELAKPTDQPRDSALLAEPASLQPIRTKCDFNPPAVLVDLDPGAEAFNPYAAAKPNLQLAAILAELRSQGATLVWLASAPAKAAPAIRKWLSDTGFDPTGADKIMLAASTEQPKEVIRRRLGAIYCLIAIVGGERADFDDLYNYLREPDAAIALESMINHGWFIASPLSSSATSAMDGAPS